MNLAVNPPVAPMLARLVRELPDDPGLLYEPKWDGFRCIVFRDGPEIFLQSRNQRALNRYFPELERALKKELPSRGVFDGEIVIASENGLDFEALLQRIHPATSRVIRLAEQTPASFVAFDLLASGSTSLLQTPLERRRHELQRVLSRQGASVRLTPATRNFDEACDWFRRFEGAGLDGVVAKPMSLEYVPGKRLMMKVKHERTADCVVGGYRAHKSGEGVGSLLLGVYDAQDVLHHVGVATGFSAAERRQLETRLARRRIGPAEGHPWKNHGEETGVEGQRLPGGPSRWSAGRDTDWVAVRPALVVEVAYDHLQGDRFRHATHFRRWRPDRAPESCRYDQFERVAPEELKEVFGRTQEKRLYSRVPEGPSSRRAGEPCRQQSSQAKPTST